MRRYWRWETVRMGLWAALDAVLSDDRSSEVLEPPCAERAGRSFTKALTSEVRKRLREMSYAPTRVECERLFGIEYVSDLIRRWSW